MGLRFTWSPLKADSNHRKHGVTFEEAASVFDDPLSITIPDPTIQGARTGLFSLDCPSTAELSPVHVEQADDVYQLISARLATRRERTQYEEG
jgi:uncharacterized DUF497 family protein